MRAYKKVFLLTVPVVVFFVLCSSAFASSESLSSSQKSTLVSQCGNITTALKSIQHADSYARTYYGSVYDEFLNNFIIPLNVRLLKNNQVNDTLAELQEKFVSARGDFNSSFIIYSKSLEELINISCSTQPEKFYSQLVVTRKNRAKVDEDISELDSLIFSQEKEVKKLMESYEKQR
ncbi:hypothetical protein IJF86_00200 [Candidatus Saccharibacteria bacterium]|nr:hypothetical protein [Candidatus Saccharibacteria bacterium]